jgi:hypothetical protein
MNRKLTWLASLLALALMVLGSPRDTALGAKAIPVDTGTYAHTSQGYDISFPQCELGFPDTPFAYGIVGVTHGHAFTYNPCLHDEFVWAQQADAAPSFYMNLNYAVGWSAGHGLSGPKGNCTTFDEACKAYNYGYNAAQDAFDYARQQGANAHIWWFDVETMNTWSPNTDLNDLVIQAAMDFFVKHAAIVGVYSSRDQWNSIAGSTFVPNLPLTAQLPNWIAIGAPLHLASRLCSPAYAFGGGRVWLVQYRVAEYDQNYAC